MTELYLLCKYLFLSFFYLLLLLTGTSQRQEFFFFLIWSDYTIRFYSTEKEERDNFLSMEVSYYPLHLKDEQIYLIPTHVAKRQ